MLLFKRESIINIIFDVIALPLSWHTRPLVLGAVSGQFMARGTQGHFIYRPSTEFLIFPRL